MKKINSPFTKCGSPLTKNTIVKNRKCCKSCLFKTKRKQTIVYNQGEETISQPERTLIVGASGCGKTTLMLSILKEMNPEDVHIISEIEDQYPIKNYIQSIEIEDLDFLTKTVTL